MSGKYSYEKTLSFPLFDLATLDNRTPAFSVEGYSRIAWSVEVTTGTPGGQTELQVSCGGDAWGDSVSMKSTSDSTAQVLGLDVLLLSTANASTVGRSLCAQMARINVRALGPAGLVGTLYVTLQP
jgi:hypothetical protein